MRISIVPFLRILKCFVMKSEKQEKLRKAAYAATGVGGIGKKAESNSRQLFSIG